MYVSAFLFLHYVYKKTRKTAGNVKDITYQKIVNIREKKEGIFKATANY